jgi:cytochrome b6-f complex iron-sulfur subunit
MGALLRTIGGLLLGGLVARLAGLAGRFHSAPAAGSGFSKVTRRGFVRNATLGAVGAILAELTIATYLLFKPNKTSPFGGEITVPAALVPAVGADPLKLPAGKFWLVNTDKGLIANYWKCVHLGCTVPWAPGSKEFRCPCHGSIYSPDGQYRGGPAPASMDWFPISVNADGSVVVDTGDERDRAKDEPVDGIAVPYQV